MHLIHRGVMKITLFFRAGACAEATGIRTVSAMDGLGRRMPLTSAAVTVEALGMIGVPLTAGFATKWWLAEGGLDAGEGRVVASLLGSSALNAGYPSRRSWGGSGSATARGTPRR